jgi:hypothetical protein
LFDQRATRREIAGMLLVVIVVVGGVGLLLLAV